MKSSGGPRRCAHRTLGHVPVCEPVLRRGPRHRTYTARVTEEPDKAKPVSLSKSGGDTASTSRPGAASATRPRTVVYAVIAMGVSAVAALLASLVLFGQSNWLKHEQAKSNSSAIKSAIASASASATSASHSVAPAVASASASATKKYPTTSSGLHHQVTQQQSGALIGSIILILASGLLAVGVYRGRHWARWAVVAFWFLASFTGTFAGITYVFAIGGTLPTPFKVPLFFSATALVVAVILVNLKPSTEYFALSRPERGAAPARRGLFAPRGPIDSGRRPAGRATASNRSRETVTKPMTSSAADRGEAYLQKQRAKKRAAANAESVARGAELARNRAKASKSRKLES
jgi:type II secretory pathway pseudopilin PulG